MLNLIHADTLTELSCEAKSSPRLRKNLNFHASNASVCHRLLNAMEPGTYIQPHCHQDVEKDETIIALRGSFGILIFDRYGVVIEHFVMAASGDNLGVTIPAGVFHSMVALEVGSVFFESKAGPYAALTEPEKADWAPVEGEVECARYLAAMSERFMS